MRLTIAHDYPMLVTGISKMIEIWIRLPLNTPPPTHVLISGEFKADLDKV